MADIKLGITGSEVILPKGVRVEIPITLVKNIMKAEMSDGSYRYGFFKVARRCTLTWKPLSLSLIQVLIDLSKLNQVLHFQNQYEDTTWYDVIIAGFSYDAVAVNGVEKYIAIMDIEGTI